MKVIIASDLHGSTLYTEKLQEVVMREQPDKLILLGDLLYHGPRNNLPVEYEPQGVYEMLNSMKAIIVAVRGNCDSEVDQDVLEFSILEDYRILEVDGLKWYLTHGHINDRLPKIGDEDIMLNGHTHRYELSRKYINPGSIAIPRGYPEHTYIIYDSGVFTLYNTAGKKLNELSI